MKCTDTQANAFRIEEGDTVMVYMVGGSQETICGTVRHKAQATGECWIIEDKHNIHYVQTFAEIRKAKA